MGCNQAEQQREQGGEKALKGTTHLAAGMVLSTFVPEPTIATTAGIAIGALLPDIDSQNSLVGKYIPVIPHLLKHRSATHSLLFPVVLYFVPDMQWLALGMLSHLALDFLNPDGLPMLWPLSKKKLKLPLFNIFFPSGGILDKALNFLLWAIALYAYANFALGSVFA